MAKTVTLQRTANDEALYPITLPENVIDSNGNNILELMAERHEYYVPTLLSVPSNSTLTYTKDGVAVEFETGDFCRVASNSTSGYDFYQLHGIVTDNGVTTASWVLLGEPEPVSTAGSAWTSFNLR
jgi:hypothetical protein